MMDNLRGAVLMMGCMAAFTFNDASIKWLAQDMPTFQVVVLRGVLAIALLVGLAHVTGALRRPVPRADWGPALGRSLAEAAAFLPFVLALPHLPLANIVAILAAIPLTLTAAGAVFLGERVGWRRWTAIGVGLVGVLLIVRPGMGDFDPWSLAIVLTVILATVRDLVTRRLSPAVPNLKIAVLTAVVITLMGGVLTLGETWATPTPRQGAVLVFAACCILAAYTFSIGAMRVGEVAVVTPFRYTSMIWGLLLGFAVFAEVPDATTLLGAAIIAATGIYTLWREARVPQPRATGPR
ncbi:DMT family transporter [Jannaschia sp. LMIT008]|uniref:DMT family transporter n=1 Tax=Jannaschia maritima TaxID=3032585 RepID=UPI002811C78B|nr:DMT family transporter [Jannaschia sp. LMIT008]